MPCENFTRGDCLSHQMSSSQMIETRHLTVWGGGHPNPKFIFLLVFLTAQVLYTPPPWVVRRALSAPSAPCLQRRRGSGRCSTTRSGRPPPSSSSTTSPPSSRAGTGAPRARGGPSVDTYGRGGGAGGALVWLVWEGVKPNPLRILSPGSHDPLDRLNRVRNQIRG